MNTQQAFPSVKKQSKLNSEGYRDMTAADALNNIAREDNMKRDHPLVYICSPFAGDTTRNTLHAQRYCRYALGEGAIPLAPHLHYPQFLDDEDPEQRRLGRFCAHVLLGRCDALWVFGSHFSKGMTAEIDRAKKRGMPIRYLNDICAEVPSK